MRTPDQTRIIMAQKPNKVRPEKQNNARHGGCGRIAEYLTGSSPDAKSTCFICESAFQAQTRVLSIRSSVGLACLLAGKKHATLQLGFSNFFVHYRLQL
jgi:hypothetical protein